MIYLFILLSILFSAFFSGMEIAYVSANRLQLELKKSRKDVRGFLLNMIEKNPSVFIGAMLIGNNISLVIYGLLTAKLFEPFLTQIIPNAFVVFIAQIILSTLIILVTAEFIPKMIFKKKANTALEFFAIPTSIIYMILYIPSLVMTGLSSLFFPSSQHTDKDLTFGKVDLDYYLNEKTQGAELQDMEHEVRLFKNALSLTDKKARECMVPRTDIVAIEVSKDLKELTRLFLSTEHSKILVYRENIDNIIGYVHHFELFKEPKTIKSMLMPIFVVPQTMPANDLLALFIKKQKSVAVVVDALGGTSGMLTIEDVVEEFTGEIEDEHDSEDLVDKKINAHTFLFSARHEIDYLNETYGLNLPDFEGVETLGGTVIQITERIPKEKEEIQYDNAFTFKIKKVEKNRIELIELHVLDQKEAFLAQ